MPSLEHHCRESVKRFGEEVREVARQHIISDLRSEGWTEEYPFPRNERHYREMGLF